MSSPGSLLSPLLFFSRSFLFYFVCVCLFSFHSKSSHSKLVSYTFPFLVPPFLLFTFSGSLCSSLFLLSRQLVKSVEIFLCLSSSVLLGPLFCSPPLQTTRRCCPPPLLLQGPDPHGRPHCRPLRSRPRGPSSTSHFDLLINNCFITWQVVTEPVSYHLIQASVFLSHSLPSFCISSPQLLHLWQLHSPLFIEPKQTDLSNLFSP